MIKRLINKIAKPRVKKKEVIVETRFTFEVFNDNSDEAKEDCKRFKQWLKDQFTEWDNSILQYFLYAYGLQQDANDEKYKLEVHISQIVKDESSTVGEINEFMQGVKDDLVDEGKEEYIEDHDKDSENIEPEVNDDNEEDEKHIIVKKKKPMNPIKLKDIKD